MHWCKRDLLYSSCTTFLFSLYLYYLTWFNKKSHLIDCLSPLNTNTSPPEMLSFRTPAPDHCLRYGLGAEKTPSAPCHGCVARFNWRCQEVNFGLSHLMSQSTRRMFLWCSFWLANVVLISVFQHVSTIEPWNFNEYIFYMAVPHCVWLPGWPVTRKEPPTKPVQ